MSPLNGARTIVVTPFIAQDRRPVWLRETAFAGLSAYHRLLLVNDGRTVPVIEAMNLERTRVRCVCQRSAAASNPLLPWLQPRAGEAVVLRQVLIEGVRSGTLYAYAASVFIPARLPAACTDLRAGIGAMLAAAKIETRRELLWWGCGGGSVASRAYRIITGNVPVFAVCEDFIR